MMRLKTGSHSTSSVTLLTAVVENNPNECKACILGCGMSGERAQPYGQKWPLNASATSKNLHTNAKQLLHHGLWGLKTRPRLNKSNMYFKIASQGQGNCSPSRICAYKRPTAVQRSKLLHRLSLSCRGALKRAVNCHGICQITLRGPRK